jgi:S-adenosylmethionine hydrolase
MAIITLTSDIGRKDYLPGAIKGRLLRMNPLFQLIDISHDLSPFNMQQAAFVVSNASRHFPEGSFHLVLVNMFESVPQHILVALSKQQYYLTANNGLLSMMLGGIPSETFAIPLPEGVTNALEMAAFMGAVVKLLSDGGDLSDQHDPQASILEKNVQQPIIGPDYGSGITYLEGQIIFIDHFENVVVNISQQLFEEIRKGRNFKIGFRREEYIDRLSTHYASVGMGEKLAYFNSAGYLEIAMNKGNAAGLFGLQGFSDYAGTEKFVKNQRYYQTVRVLFE